MEANQPQEGQASPFPAVRAQGGRRSQCRSEGFWVRPRSLRQKLGTSGESLCWSHSLLYLSSHPVHSPPAPERPHCSDTSSRWRAPDWALNQRKLSFWQEVHQETKLKRCVSSYFWYCVCKRLSPKWTWLCQRESWIQHCWEWNDVSALQRAGIKGFFFAFVYKKVYKVDGINQHVLQRQKTIVLTKLSWERDAIKRTAFPCDWFPPANKKWSTQKEGKALNSNIVGCQ